MVPPNPLYIVSVVETVQSALRNTEDPAEIRRYLCELRDILYESDFESDLAEELYNRLEQHIDRLNGEFTDSINETRRDMIIDDVHRFERFCQRRRNSETAEYLKDKDSIKLGNHFTINIGAKAGNASSPGTDSKHEADGSSDWEDDDQWNSGWI
jgi:hypothetical protein